MPAPDGSATTGPPELVVYASLNCPYSALANYRASWLEATLQARVDVRLVCRPEDTTRRDVGGDLRRRLEDEVDEVQDLLVEGPVFPLHVPRALPDVREATQRYAHHHARRSRTRECRVRLFRGLWLRGVDISEDATLDALGVTGPAAPEHAGRWQDAWTGIEPSTVPLLVTPTGQIHRGRDALDELLSMRSGGTGAVAAS